VSTPHTRGIARVRTESGKISESNKKSNISRSKLVASQGKSLTDVQYSMTLTVDLAKVHELRNNFHAKLQALQVDIRKSQKAKTDCFTAQEATSITNFFFAELVGTAPKRLKKLVEGYQCSKEERIGFGSLLEAENLAQDKEVPSQLRDYLASFSRVIRNTNQGQAIGEGISRYGHIEGLMENVHMRKLYRNIVDAADAKEPNLTAYLQQAGYSTATGRTWKSEANRFLREKLRISSSALNNFVLEAEVVSNMVHTFGTGILLILPDNAPAR
jgi:hypothetical protein